MKRGYLIYFVLVLFLVPEVYSIEQGLVAYHSLDEIKNGAVDDLSGNGYNGVLYTGNNPGVGNAALVDGKVGKAIQFSGQESVLLTIPTINTAVGTKVTVEFWMYWTGSSHMMPFGSQGYTLYFNPAVPLQFGFNTGAGDVYGIKDASNLANKWVYVVAEFNNGDAKLSKLYIDGVEQTISQQLGTTGNIQLTQYLAISGFRLSASYRFVGKLDEVKIYNKAFTADEIKKKYENYQSGLLASWNFDEGSGTTVTDNSVNKNTGTLINNPTWVDGVKGKALEFDGVNDYVDAGNPMNLQITKDLSIEAWIKPSANGKTLQYIVAKGNDDAYSQVAYLLSFLDSSGKLFFSVSNNAANDWVRRVSATSLEYKKWYHVVGVYKPSQILSIYVNGVLDDGSLEGIIPSSLKNPNKKLYVGAQDRVNNPYNFKGIIDEVRIYNKALTAEEIKKSYDESKPQLESQEPIAYWNFDEGSGTTASDSSGNGNTGTLVNNPTWVDGINGKALSFDGVDKRINIPSTVSYSYELDDSFSIESWIKTNHIGRIKMIVSKENYPIILIRLRVDSLGRLEVDLRDENSKESMATSANIYTDGNWHHVVAVRDTENDNVKLYADGIQVASTTDVSTGSIKFDNSDGYFTIGDSINYANFDFTGVIDEVKIYNRALTAEEVKKSYDESKPQLESQEPIAYWNFDEGSGTTIADSSVNKNTGTLVNNPTWVDGVKGKALEFDGVNDYVNIPYSKSLDIKDNFAIEAWIKPLSLNLKAYAITKSSGSNTPPYYHYALQFDNNCDDKLEFNLGINNLLSSICSNTVGVSGNWYHIVGVYDSNSQKLYINGLLENTKSISGKINSYQTPLIMGKLDTTNSNLFKGYIDEVKIYNRALSESEILENYQSTLPQKPTCETSCYWKVGDKVTGGNEQIIVENGVIVQAKADCLKDNNGYLLTDGTQVNFIVKEYNPFLLFDGDRGTQTSGVVSGSSSLDVLTNYIDETDTNNKNELYFYLKDIKDCDSKTGDKQLLYVNKPVECSENKPCPEGKVCESGSCVPAPLPPSCSDSIPCPQGEQCVAGQCELIPPQCTFNAGCNAGEICVNGNCQTQETPGDETGGGVSTPTSETAEFVPITASKELAFPVPKKYTLSSSNLDQGLFNNLESIDIFPAYNIEGQTKYCDTPYTYTLK